MADSENTDRAADGGARKVRPALLSLSLSRGELWAVGEGWLCQESVWWSRTGAERFGGVLGG